MIESGDYKIHVGNWFYVLVFVFTILSLFGSCLTIFLFNRYFKYLKNTLNYVLMLATMSHLMGDLIRAMVGVALTVQNFPESRNESPLTPISCDVLQAASVFFAAMASGFLAAYYVHINVVLRRGEVEARKWLKFYVIVVLLVATGEVISLIVKTEDQVNSNIRFEEQKHKTRYCHFPLSAIITDRLAPLLSDCVMVLAGICAVVKLYWTMTEQGLSSLAKKFLAYRTLFLVLQFIIAVVSVIDGLGGITDKTHVLLLAQNIFRACSGTLLFLIFVLTEGIIFLIENWIDENCYCCCFCCRDDNDDDNAVLYDPYASPTHQLPQSLVASEGNDLLGSQRARTLSREVEVSYNQHYQQRQQQRGHNATQLRQEKLKWNRQKEIRAAEYIIKRSTTGSAGGATSSTAGGSRRSKRNLGNSGNSWRGGGGGGGENKSAPASRRIQSARDVFDPFMDQTNSGSLVFHSQRDIAASWNAPDNRSSINSDSSCGTEKEKERRRAASPDIQHRSCDVSEYDDRSTTRTSMCSDRPSPPPSFQQQQQHQHQHRYTRVEEEENFGYGNSHVASLAAAVASAAEAAGSSGGNNATSGSSPPQQYQQLQQQFYYGGDPSDYHGTYPAGGDGASGGGSSLPAFNPASMGRSDGGTAMNTTAAGASPFYRHAGAGPKKLAPTASSTPPWRDDEYNANYLDGGGAAGSADRSAVAVTAHSQQRSQASPDRGLLLDGGWFAEQEDDPLRCLAVLTFSGQIILSSDVQGGLIGGIATTNEREQRLQSIGGSGGYQAI